MLIEMSSGQWPSDHNTTLVVGELRYTIGRITADELRADILAFAAGLNQRLPFAPEFGYEPLFNVEFKDDTFVAYSWRPRFKSRWLWWLGGRKIVSRPENLDVTLAYLDAYAIKLRRV